MSWIVPFLIVVVNYSNTTCYARKNNGLLPPPYYWASCQPASQLPKITSLRSPLHTCNVLIWYTHYYIKTTTVANCCVIQERCTICKGASSAGIWQFYCWQSIMFRENLYGCSPIITRLHRHPVSLILENLNISC